MTRGGSKAWAFLRILFVRLRFIFIFIVIGIIVGNWRWIMNVVDRWTRPAKAEDMVKGEFEYYCPMHPSVVRPDDKEKCPICGMPLSKRRRGEATEVPAGVLGRLQLSPFRIRQAGIATQEVAYRTLVREVRTVGFIEWDERRVAQLSAQIAGRADELFVDFTGVRIRKGDPVYKLYSPDLVTTQEEYVLAMNTLEQIQSRPEPDPEALRRAKKLADSARERLLLWGITPEQVATLERERTAHTHLTIFSPLSGIVTKKNILAGQYVQVGDDPYTIANDSVVWMQAEVFERDLGLIREGQTAEVTTEAFPGESFEGRIVFIQPMMQAETRTVKARVEIPNPHGKLKQGLYATAVIRVPLGRRGELYYTCCPACGEIKAEGPEECTICGMMYVQAGGVPEAHAQEPPEVFYMCPMHHEVKSDAPGRCPQCGMELQRHEKRAERPHEKPETERTIYVCPMHPERIWDKPGECTACGGMKLAERKVVPGARVAFVCPEHSDVVSDAPGTCPRDGKALHFKIVSEPSRLEETWSCSHHPEQTSPTKGPCPKCGHAMKRYEIEHVLAVPFSAVIDTGLRKVVFVERDPGTFEAVEVKFGPRAGEYYQVLGGLEAGDRVVTAGAFLLDAEARLNPAAATQYFGASGHEGHK
ncbi:MAG: efflux RND transporter periplasmic adaptor subunit [Planctomycetes bacterium]|nr:efflux RND transporter periplasmic adaptor subunit [Planctomycetota bacterium]